MSCLKWFHSVSTKMNERGPVEDGTCPLKREGDNGPVFRSQLDEERQEAWNLGELGFMEDLPVLGRKRRRPKRRGMRRTG